MRALFLAFLLANVAFFVYSKWLRAPEASADVIPRLQVNPEKIRILPPAERERIGAAPRPALACLQWGTFSGADVTRADAAMAGLALGDAAIQRAITDVSGYWVYLPPGKNKTETDRRLAQLKAKGVQDYYVVQDAGQWHNAISLGIFKSEEAAHSRLAKLKSGGVQGVSLQRREHFLKQVAYLVREPNAGLVARLAELQRDFPGTEVKAVACPPFDASAG